MDASNSLVLTKLDVARRQLDTAIHLWFHEGDPVSTHTLAFSANKVLRGICQHRQVEEPILFDLKRIKKGNEKEYMRLLHAAPNFFKHADNDAGDTFVFSPNGAEYLLFDACETYFFLASHRTPLMTAFRFRFCVSNPHLWGDGLLQSIKETFDFEMLRGLSRKEFFDYFNPRPDI